MNTLEKPVEIAEGHIVFSADALHEAAEQGAIDPEYLAQIKRQQAAEAITGAFASVRDTITGAIGNVASAAVLEGRMLVFDKLHGTNYRGIRHNLIEQERRRKFEASIGLIATKK